MQKQIETLKLKNIELRKLIDITKDPTLKIIENTKSSFNHLQKYMATFQEQLTQKDITIEELKQNNENAGITQNELNNRILELELENTALKEQVNILNSQMDQLDKLVADIEGERSQTLGLKNEIKDYEESLAKLPHEIPTSEAVRETKHLEDALHSTAAQLDSELNRNNHLEEINAELRLKIAKLEEHLQMISSSMSDLELSKVSIEKMSEEIQKLNEENASLREEIKLLKNSIVPSSTNEAEEVSIPNILILSFRSFVFI